MLRLAVGLVIAGLALGAGAWALGQRPDLSRYDALQLPPAPAGGPRGRLVATFLGVSTVLFSDGRTALMTDGFFTRPGLGALLPGRRIAPDPERIGRALEAAGVRELAAVLVVHSHYDHAMDAPEVARRTGAVLVGSASTAQVGRGWGLPEERLRVVEPGHALRFGAFRVTFVRSRHVPLPLVGKALFEPIDAPLVPPAHASAWKEGGSWSILIEHPGGKVLVQASAGFVEGALRRYDADVVLLGVGMLARQDEAYREAYFREVVEAVGARRVLPIHWDDFTRPLDLPLVAFPRGLDDVEATLSWLAAHTEATPGVELRMLPFGRRVALVPSARLAEDAGGLLPAGRPQ